MDITEQVRMREQLRLYSARIRKAQEEERTAISRVLHDETIQSLTAVGLRLDTIMAEHDLPQPVMGEIESLANILLDQSDALRRLCMGLRPAMLDRMGLGVAIEWLVRRTCAENAVAGTVRIGEGLRRLNANVEIRLFRIAQEAVNNAVRHARAKRVEVSLGINNGHLELEVGDDGIGFDMTTQSTEHPHGEKLGLLGMRERARMLGASLHIHSTPGEGCRVFLRGSVEQMEANA
jgi:signal transduction histidine kinase